MRRAGTRRADRPGPRRPRRTGGLGPVLDFKVHPCFVNGQAGARPESPKARDASRHLPAIPPTAGRCAHRRKGQFRPGAPATLGRSQAYMTRTGSPGGRKRPPHRNKEMPRRTRAALVKPAVSGHPDPAQIGRITPAHPGTIPPPEPSPPAGARTAHDKGPTARKRQGLCLTWGTRGRVSGDGGNRTRVQRCGTRASPCAVRYDFLGPGDHADKSPTGSVTVWFPSSPRDRDQGLVP